MPLPNPCPCMTLQTGTKAIAILEMVFGVISIIMFALAMVGLTVIHTDAKNGRGSLGDDPWHYAASDQAAESARQIALVILCVSLVVVIVGLIVSILLFIGASKSNANYLMVWLVLTGISMPFLLWEMITGQPRSFVGFFLRIYFMWVVYVFRAEIKEKEPPGHTINPA